MRHPVPQASKPVVLRLYGHRTNPGGIAAFYSKMCSAGRDSRYRFVHFRVGRIQRIGAFRFWPLRLADMIWGYLQFITRLLTLRPAIVHLNPSLEAKSIYREAIFRGLISIFSRRSKVITHIHGWRESLADSLHQGSFFRRVLAYLLSRSDVVIVLATRFKERLESLDLGFEPVRVLPTAVESDLYDQPRDAASPGLNVLCLSRVVASKGIFDLLEAVPALLDKHAGRELRFVFAGDGDDLTRLRRQVESLGIADRVALPGYVRGTSKLDLLRNASIFVLPSHDEGCPVAVLEAMAAGLPVVATRVGALGEILDPGVHGLLVDPHSSDQLRVAIEHLVSNAPIREAMGQANRDRAKEVFDVGHIFCKLESLYDEALGRPTRS